MEAVLTPRMRLLDRTNLLLLPALLVLAAAFVWPVAFLLSRAFTYPVPGFGNFVQLWERPVYLRVILNTVTISAVVTPVCLLLGFPVAHAMAHGSPRLRRWLVLLVLIPFWTSLLVRSFATVILLQRNGPLNGLLMATGLISEPLPLLYNLTGVVLGAVQVLLPFVIFPLHATMARIEPSWMQAALTLGAGPIRAFWRVYLPLTLPGLLTGAALVFISTLGYYVVPALLGGPRELMVAQLIQDQIGNFGNWGMAGALSIVLIAGTGLLMLAVHATVGLKAVAR
ncbi:MAG: ABC transporter permease [Deltaproteobacteria bacterium]|nr:MAG: ABC transporter permease [Deltaproteobacteria bacterium]